MDAEQALADLIEVSSQIEGAVLFGPDGAVAASSFGDDGRAERVAGAARALVAAAEETQSEKRRAALTQLHATSSAGGVFCVREGDRMVAAVTKPDPTVGLVLYDLRTCLRLAAAEPKKSARASRSHKPKKAAAKEPDDA